MASPVLGRGEGSPPSSCWQGFAHCSPGHHSPPPLGKGTLLAPGQLGVHQDPQGLFCHAAFLQLCQAGQKVTSMCGCVPRCFVPVPVPSAVGPTLSLQLSWCHCHEGEQGMFPPAKAVVQVERLALVMAQGEGGCTLETESRDEVSTELHLCLFSLTAFFSHKICFSHGVSVKGGGWNCLLFPSP